MDGAGLWARASAKLPPDAVTRLSATAPVDDETRLAAETSLRKAFIVLAVINCLVGAVTALGIYVDCRLKLTRKGVPLSGKSPFIVIGAKEMLPFVVSLGIVAQGALFGAAQTNGLDSVLALGCRGVSQIMLPALLIVPLIQLVFGIEATVRSVPRRPVVRGPGWLRPVLAGLVAIGLVVAYGLTFMAEAPNFCFAELLFLVKHWSEGILALFTSIGVLLLLCSGIIMLRLYRTPDMMLPQRTTASWTACYLLLAVLTLFMTLPVFGSLLADDGVSDISRGTMVLSTGATIIINMTGVLTGVLYLVLRLTRLGRLGEVEFDRDRLKSDIRTVGTSSSVYSKQLDQPLSPEWFQRPSYGSRADEKKAMSKTPIPPKAGAPSYNLFPKRPDAAPTLLIPPTAPWANRSERNSSLGSSASVPIALRVSNIDMLPMEPESQTAAPNLGLAISTYGDQAAAYLASKNSAVFDFDDDELEAPPPLVVTKATPDDFTLSPSVYSPESSSSSSVESVYKPESLSGESVYSPESSSGGSVRMPPPSLHGGRGRSR
ncbi:hypothetical protein CDD80_4278 [Ophiocordyceps camponoti-rufipedis]|uniref:Uncharacterized protein n=1 Tax=Ophiocordyceps camponoti-rufipedis TaxID=2004952 RepID=A0A2C5YTA0_9HYPO|nr:hypothetical protein CDD80_4278 [Ophiocordyceps camponoti-rufipedis]